MLIAIDIGNSSINIGFFTTKGLFVKRIATHPLLSSSQYESFINQFIREKNIDKTPEGIIISSVVPGRTEGLTKTLKRIFSVEPLLVNYRINTGIRLDIPMPEELGSDRLANIVAAYEICKCPSAVIDFGTATTISVVGRNANYIGGAIMPGIRLMNESLAKGTSRLSRVEISPPGSVLGIDTTKCIQAGLLYGTAGAVERLLQEIEREAGFRLKVIATGGYSGLISPFLKRKHEVIPHLTLEGLKIVYAKNADA